MTEFITIITLLKLVVFGCGLAFFTFIGFKVFELIKTIRGD